MTQVTKTYLPDPEKYKRYIDAIFASGWVTNNGPLVRELEARLEAYLGVKHLILVSSGTAALEVAYRVLGLKGEVITTPFSFVATTSSLMANGLAPRFADIDPRSFNIDPERILERISPETSAIVPVHVFGNGCDVEAIGEIARAHGLKVVYDAAHAFGVRCGGKSLLEHGDISTLSFHATKIFHTVEGGALVTDDDELAQKARFFRNFGIQGPESIPALGVNAKMNEFEAAMGLCLLDDMPAILDGRQRVYERYRDALEGVVQMQARRGDCTRNYSHFPVVFESEAVLKRVEAALHAVDVVPRRYFYPSLDTLEYIVPPQPMELSRRLSERILCLPLHDRLDAKIQEKIIATVTSSL